jgi:hypothetical protein
MTLQTYRRTLALALVVSMALAIAPSPVLAAESGVVVGKVLAADGVTPLSGVVVSLVDSKSQQVFSSSPSSDRGAFETSAPAGDYRVVADTSNGAFLTAGAVRVAAGANPPMSLTLRQAAAQEPGTPPPPPPPATPPSTISPWAKWVIVGGIVVAGILVVDAVTSDDDEPVSSPSQPGGE